MQTDSRANPQKIQVLLLEDSPNDAELVIRELRRAGFEPEWKRVETESDFLAALQTSPQLILADYSLPHFDGLRALRLLRGSGLDIPFILVSGIVGEEAAISAIKEGADDYVMKDRLGHLDSAVPHALESKRLRAERRQAAEALRASEAFARNLIRSSLDMIIAVDHERRIVEFNEAAQQAFGYSHEEILGQPVDLLYAEPSEGLAVNRSAIQEGRCVREIRNKRKNGEIFSSLLSASVLLNNERGLIGVMGVSRDITERKRADEELRRRNEELERFNRATVGREARMIELKQQVNALSRQLRRPAPYPLEFLAAKDPNDPEACD